MVGNPLTYMPYRDYGCTAPSPGHNLLHKPLWDQYLKAGCREKDSSATCQGLMDQMNKLTADMDPYALDFPVCTDQAKAAGRHSHTVLKAMGRLSGYFPGSTPRATATGPPSTSTTPRSRLPSTSPRTNVTWAECSDSVGSKYSQTGVVLPMMPVPTPDP